MNLEKLGWNALFETQLSENETNECAPARVVEELKNTYRLYAEGGELLAEVSGKMRHLAVNRDDLPVVGDWVVVQERPEERRATIHRILQRKSKISRKTSGEKTTEQIVATNIDIVFLVNSLNREFNLRRIERYLTLIWEGGAGPVVILNKADLCDNPKAFVEQVESIAPGVPIHVISALKNQGTDALQPYLGKGQTSALLGSSGVGKSTLLNRLVGEEIQRIREIRERDDRGRHTTSSRQLILLPHGGVIIDTPGMRELQLWDSRSGFQQTFEEIEAIANHCHFRNCQHQTEPGCAVRRAMRDGTIDPDRFQNYQKLQKELNYLTRKQDNLAKLAEKKKWKQIHRAQKRSRPRW